MAIDKNIADIISIKHSCKDVIQELYDYESRPYEGIKESYKASRVDDAVHFDIMEYDEFSDELSLSVDTLEYYEARLGQVTQTNIGVVGDKLSKLEIQLNFYNQRVRNQETPDKEIKATYNILAQLPSLLKHNLKAISSNSIVAFKSESNFEIKMQKLDISKDEISKLIEATYKCDKFLIQKHHFFKSMDNYKINSAILKYKKESIVLEKAFIKLFDDIKNFINQSMKDGAFVKKLQLLKELKDDKKLFSSTNIQELVEVKHSVANSVKIKKLHPDDKITDYIGTIEKIVLSRKMEIVTTKSDDALRYDIDEVEHLHKKLYDYQRLNKEFLAQDENLIYFLQDKRIDKDRLLGVFVRMLKNYVDKYEVDDMKFIQVDDRQYIEVMRCS